ncbi:bactofilin family protein [Pseudodesulfovibrio tunisiensis]|uniref:bactofilin family protein n=1 Tax=Pseudodesulfovibrio tunisiensis TaxID=463192 RepID=UPI001FB2B7F9|nr:polymer-forming cytoskeletal protein [Pseudodesulfovibrio tunisiensis]
MARDEINAFLGAGTNYQGKLHFQGAVRIDGNFQGEVVSDGTLVVGQEAVVEGQVRVGQLVLSGSLRGEVEAKERVVLHKTANLQGDIRTPILVVEEGAILEGQLSMGSPESAPAKVSEEDSTSL